MFNQSTLTLIALASIVIGLVSCFYGYRFFRIYLAIIGFFVGFSLASSFVAESDTTIQLLVGTVGGLIGAGILSYLYFIGVFVAGVGLGATIGLTVLSSTTADSTVIIIGVVICAIIGGFIAMLLNKVMIVLATSFIGSAQIIYGGAILLVPDVVVETQTKGVQLDFQSESNTSIVMLILWISLGLIGVLYQLRNNHDLRLFGRRN